MSITYTDNSTGYVDADGIIRDNSPNDAQKLQAWFDRIFATTTDQPELESEKAKQVMNTVYDEIAGLVNQAAKMEIE